MEVKCGVPKFSNPYQYNIVLGYCFGNMSKYQNFASVIRQIYISIKIDLHIIII